MRNTAGRSLLLSEVRLFDVELDRRRGIFLPVDRKVAGRRLLGLEKVGGEKVRGSREKVPGRRQSDRDKA